MAFHVSLLITAVSCHSIRELVFSVQREEDDRFSISLPHKSILPGRRDWEREGQGRPRRASSVWFAVGGTNRCVNRNSPGCPSANTVPGVSWESSALEKLLQGV